MSVPQRASDKKFSYADYLTWGDDERWEIIDGVPYAMSPSPLWRHQRIALRLGGIFDQHLIGKKFQAAIAPSDVRLPDEPNDSEDQTYTIVQPDVFVVCDPEKLDRRGCVGAPDLAVEILSDSTSTRDWEIKKELYQRHGVREYWIVNPWANLVEVYSLNSNGLYGLPKHHTEEDVIESSVLPGLRLELKRVFAV